MSRALVIVAALGLAGQTGPAAVDPHLVHLHATVTDRTGAAVSDLTASDFEVTEGGASLTVEEARFVAPPPPGTIDPPLGILTREDEVREASREGTRLVAVYLDEYHVTAGENADRARDAARTLVGQLAPRDMVVVVKPLDSLMNIRLTRDRARTGAALSTFEGRRGLYAPRTLFEKSFIAADPERVDAARAQISTAAISALVDHLDKLGEGRKALVVVTEGFGRGPRRRDGLPTLTGLARTASRGGVAVYPIDPRALAPPAASSAPANLDEDRAAREALQSLADASGGAALMEQAPLAPFLARIVGDLSGYYQLTVRASAGSSAFRSVQIRSLRSGTSVRGVSGYYGPTATELARAEREAKELAADVAAGFSRTSDNPPTAASGGDVTTERPSLRDLRNANLAPRPTTGSTGLIQSWLGLSAGSEGRTSVNFVWEPAAVGADRGRGEPVHVAIKAEMEDGTVVYEGVVARTDASPEGPQSIVFPAPPGRMRVLLAIVDRDSELMGVEVRDLRVRRSDGPLWLGTPAVFRGRTDEELRARAADSNAAPAASREFTPEDRVLVRVSALADAEVPKVTATIVSQTLRMGWLLPVTPGPTAGHYDVAIPIAGLGEGTHDIEVMAETPSARATETVTIRVTR